MGKLFCNATFVPLTDEDARAEALLVDDEGRIAFVGPLEEARERAGGAEEVDLGGAAVLPGLIDPHSHFTGSLQYLLFADLSECTSFAEITDTLREFAAKRRIGPDGVIMGNGYDQNNLVEQRHPDKSVLNAVSTDVPVLITHVSNHMGVANDRLLELAGITPTTPDPEGGRYGRMDGTGDLDGYAEEPAAMNPFYAVTTPRLGLDFNAMIGDMQRIYLEHGVTTCQDGATAPDMAAVLAGLAKAGLLQMDIVAYPMWGTDVMATLAANPEYDSQDYHGHFRFGGLKMFLDGSPQGLTAWMTEPYAEGPDGERDWVAYGTMTDEDAAAFAKIAIDSNHQLLCHCNGDAAADQLLRVYEAARDASGNPGKAALRPVMIHAQTARADQYGKMAEIGMIPSIFSSHIWYWGDAHLRNLGPARGGRVSACGDAARAGLPFTLHTDTPVLRPNLLEAAWCAVNRVTKAGAQLDEDQKVTPYEAMRAITFNGAYQYGEEDLKGTLEAGKLADLVVLDRNPLAVDPREIRDIKVLATIKEGAVIYRRDEA
ncbi:amidohydrolase [Adlercreutzia muris]|uniref:amidohydrolase n=1 Tax=Adlercreutzia muris TaxID=1796610 RepID=UPI0021D596A1|nr:amidohydrolase [Adlercreutzia muris]MCU7585821.1 amidohydrolase [Adlercreutzia muris]